jgi:hypothetical protein
LEGGGAAPHPQYVGRRGAAALVEVPRRELRRRGQHVDEVVGDALALRLGQLPLGEGRGPAGRGAAARWLEAPTQPVKRTGPGAHPGSSPAALPRAARTLSEPTSRPVYTCTESAEITSPPSRLASSRPTLVFPTAVGPVTITMRCFWLSDGPAGAVPPAVAFMAGRREARASALQHVLVRGRACDRMPHAGARVRCARRGRAPSLLRLLRRRPLAVASKPNYSAVLE